MILYRILQSNPPNKTKLVWVIYGNGWYVTSKWLVMVYLKAVKAYYGHRKLLNGIHSGGNK